MVGDIHYQFSVQSKNSKTCPDAPQIMPQFVEIMTRFFTSWNSPIWPKIVSWCTKIV